MADQIGGGATGRSSTGSASFIASMVTRPKASQREHINATSLDAIRESVVLSEANEAHAVVEARVAHLPSQLGLVPLAAPADEIKLDVNTRPCELAHSRDRVEVAPSQAASPPRGSRESRSKGAA